MRARSDAIEPEKADRGAGFLTKTEREYLLGTWAPGDAEPGEWSRQQESTKRSNIKTRTRHALADIALLREHGDDELIKGVVERKSGSDSIPTFYQETLEHTQQGLTAFMLLLALEEEQAEAWMDGLEEMDLADVAENLQENLQGHTEKRSAGKRTLDTYPVVRQSVEDLKEGCESLGISKEEMVGAIEVGWE